MCFDYHTYAEVWQETRPRARKQYRCCECHMPILIGEQHVAIFTVFEGEAESFRLCVFCEWLRERIADHERAAGCHNVYPPMPGLTEALNDGYDKQIGLRSLGWYKDGFIYSDD